MWANAKKSPPSLIRCIYNGSFFYLVKNSDKTISYFWSGSYMIVYHILLFLPLVLAQPKIWLCKHIWMKYNDFKVFTHFLWRFKTKFAPLTHVFQCAKCRQGRYTWKFAYSVSYFQLGEHSFNKHIRYIYMLCSKVLKHILFSWKHFFSSENTMMRRCISSVRTYQMDKLFVFDVLCQSVWSDQERSLFYSS